MKLTEDDLYNLTAAVQDHIATGRAAYGEGYSRRYWVRQAFLVIRDRLAEGDTVEEALAWLDDETATLERASEPKPSRAILAYSWS